MADQKQPLNAIEQLFSELAALAGQHAAQTGDPRFVTLAQNAEAGADAIRQVGELFGETLPPGLTGNWVPYNPTDPATVTTGDRDGWEPYLPPVETTEAR